MSLESEAAAALATLAERHLLRIPRVVEGRRGPEICINGRWLLNVSSNDYLGLADHAVIRQAGIDCLQRLGGSSASRLVVGNHIEHETLAGSLRAWLGYPDVCLFNSGVAANMGVISALTHAGDLILSDQLNHASIIDGCKLSKAEVAVYLHGDVVDLEQRLRAARRRRVFIVTESLFSMDGDIVDIVAISKLCARYGASLIVDEAHALGVIGPQGRGVCAAVGVTADVLIGTFGKALGVYGAFAATSKSVAALLWNRARSLVYTTGLPSAVVAMCSEAIHLVAGAEGEQRRLDLRGLVAAASTTAADLHFDGTLSVATHIVPVLCADEATAMEAATRCESAGFLALAIRPPTVAVARVRLCLRSDLSPENVTDVLGVLAARN